MIVQKEDQAKSIILYDLAVEVIQCRFFIKLFMSRFFIKLINKSLSFHWIQEGRNQTPPLNERCESFMLSPLHIWLLISHFLKFSLFFVNVFIHFLKILLRLHFGFLTSSFLFYFLKSLLLVVLTKITHLNIVK